MNIRVTGPNTAMVQSRTDPEKWYNVNVDAETCDCPANQFKHMICAHLREAKQEIEMNHSPSITFSLDDHEWLKVEAKGPLIITVRGNGKEINQAVITKSPGALIK